MLARARRVWSSYLDRVTPNNELPLECVQLQNMLGRVPIFPTNQVKADEATTRLQLHHQKIGDDTFELFASGTSTWRTSDAKCDLKAKTMRHQLLLGTQCSTVCSFSKDSRFANWPGVQGYSEGATEGNHLAILAFAWAYILSVTWFEMQQSNNVATSASDGTDFICYLNERVKYTYKDISGPTDDILIDIGDANDVAARWWAAILAPGEGWRATLLRDGKIYHSPWSVSIQSSELFKLRRSAHLQSSSDGSSIPLPGILPTSQEALGFLSDFCTLHSVHDQSAAALAATLLFPFLRGSTISLPRPKLRLFQDTKTALPLLSPSNCLPELVNTRQVRDLIPYYMTLSCNCWGIRALLYGAFFDPYVSCNLVSPWLEPAFEIIDAIVTRGDYETLAVVMCERQPNLGALWLGAIITGMEKHIFQVVHSGMSAVELHAAAWTSTIHSFISIKPTASACNDENKIYRSDECRLIFLTDCEGYSKPPICAWQPFGTVSISDTDIEIRKHAKCEGHCLEYISWRWNLIDSTSFEDEGFTSHTRNDREAIEKQRSPCAAGSYLLDGHKIENLESDLLSEVATRTIFSWLRMTGYLLAERDIHTHSWIDMGDFDDESITSTDDSKKELQDHQESKERIEEWLDNIVF